MRLSFYKQRRTIYFSIIEKGVRLRITTGISLPEGTDFKDGLFVGEFADELNEFLSNKKTEILSLWRQRHDLDYVRKMYKPEYFMVKPKTSFELLFMLREQYRQMEAMGRQSKNTMKGYWGSIKKLADYVSDGNGTIDILDYTSDHRDSMNQRKQKIDRYIQYFRKFEDYLSDHEYVLSSRFTIMRCLASLINMICESYNISLPKVPLPVLKHNPVITLQPDFVAKFVSDQYKIYDGLDEDQKYAWEIAATILVTTFRLSDALSLSMNDISEREGRMFIAKMNKKTGQFSYIPVPSKMAAIFKSNYEKYGDIYTKHFSGTSIPMAIKDVFSMISEMHEEIVMKRIGVKGEEIINIMPIYKAIHPHMLRKTAITTMVYMGVSDRHIKFASGHSENSRAFERYVGHVEKMFKTELIDYYEKLGI